MKFNYKKYFYTALGVFTGVFFYGGVNLEAAITFPSGSNGNPAIFEGMSGTRVSGRGSTGKFTSIQQLGMEIIMLIETRIVPLIMSLALLAFLWGILQYIRKGGEPAEREQARQFMLWGIIGLAVMASVWGLVRILTNTIGVPMGIPSLDPIK
jgi:hypothetical protein